MPEINKTTTACPATDPARWVDEHGDSLFRYALGQVRDQAVAEDVVQETFLAALKARDRFTGRCSERTWLVGILKHKIADHFRRTSRECRAEPVDGLPFEEEELFSRVGPWAGHWTGAGGPGPWGTDPHEVLEQGEFWAVLQGCLDELPPRLARAFWLREVEGATTEEICKVLDVSPTNLWVMLHRARMHLRRSLELKWFSKKANSSNS